MADYGDGGGPSSSEDDDEIIGRGNARAPVATPTPAPAARKTGAEMLADLRAKRASQSEGGGGETPHASTANTPTRSALLDRLRATRNSGDPLSATGGMGGGAGTRRRLAKHVSSRHTPRDCIALLCQCRLRRRPTTQNDDRR
jgi:hypothetical protein